MNQQISVIVEVSVNEYTAQLANNNGVCMFWYYVTEVTYRRKCFVFGTSLLSAQCSGL